MRAQREGRPVVRMLDRAISMIEKVACATKECTWEYNGPQYMDKMKEIVELFGHVLNSKGQGLWSHLQDPKIAIFLDVFSYFSWHLVPRPQISLATY